MAIEDYLTIAPHTDDVIETDAVIVGAGPVGLFQVFELGLLEIKAHVVDSLKNVGGQCMELYPTKPIYDIPAVPVYSSYELTENLLKQIHPFGAQFHLGEEVTVVKKREDGRFDVETDKGTRFLCKVVIIAAGVGSFQARPLRVPGIEKFEGTQLHYRVRDPELFKGKNIVICGGGDSALDWTLNLVGKAESVVLIHRRDGFRAQTASVAKMKELCENWEMQFEVGQVTGFEEKDGRMTEIRVTGADGVLVSSSTGSTAYAMAAGGPIMHPHVLSMLLVPIAPHTLSNRPVVLSSTSVVDIEINETRSAVASFDAQVLFDVAVGDIVRVSVSPNTFTMLHPIGYNHFDLLRRKLKWNYLPQAEKPIHVKEITGREPDAENDDTPKADPFLP